jgi:hypothetical protein
VSLGTGRPPGCDGSVGDVVRATPSPGRSAPARSTTLPGTCLRCVNKGAQYGPDDVGSASPNLLVRYLARVFVRRAPVPFAGGPFSGVAVVTGPWRIRRKRFQRRGNHCSFGGAKEYVAKPRALIMSCLFTPQCGSCKKIHITTIKVFGNKSVLRKTAPGRLFQEGGGGRSGRPAASPARREAAVELYSGLHGLRASRRLKAA